MTIIRGPRLTDHYTRYDNRLLRDARLSYRARGLLVYMLSHEPDWRVTAETLSEHGREGREAIRTALIELEEAGYLKRSKHQDERGHWRTNSVISEVPESGFPGAGEAAAGSRNTKREKEHRETPRQSRGGGAKPQSLRLVETPTDADRLAVEMLNALAANGCRLPKTANVHAPERWVKDFDLLLRVDERPIAEVRAVLRWTMNDDWEKAVVLSPGKFRARYDSLRLKARRGAVPQNEVTEIVSHIRSAITSYGVRRRAEAMADLSPAEQSVVEKVGWGALCSSASADLAGLVRSALVRGAS
jgi:hypothetical protein